MTNAMANTGLMSTRNGWLFPLMVLAAGSVTVFGCIGIAAITGYLPLAKVSATPFGEPALRARDAILAGVADGTAHTVIATTVASDADTARTAEKSDKPSAARKKASPR